jgi:hypothetical protein
MSRAAVSWLNDLATLVAGATPIGDLKTKIAGMSAMLGDDYPPEAFTRLSLGYVARQCKFFPAYGELTGYLSEWWRENRPPPSTAALPAPSGQRNVEEEDRQFWNAMSPQQIRERVATIEADNRPPAGSQAALKRTTVSGLTRYAPHLLAFLPPDWLPKEGVVLTTPAAEAAALFPGLAEPERPKPSYFTPEQLASLRAKPKAAA